MTARQIHPVRLVLAVTFALYVAVLAAMPHVHAPDHDRHACIACSTAASEACEPVFCDLAPRLLPPVVVVPVPMTAPPAGAPLGAKPGQSPPRA